MATRVGQCWARSQTIGGSTIAGTYSANVANGDTVIVGLEVSNGLTVTAVADDAGNTYTQVDPGNATPARGTSMWYCRNVSGITTAKTLTVTLSGAAFDAIGFADDISTIDGLLDVHANASNTTSTTPSVGPTSAVAQSKEFFYALFGGTNTIGGGSPPAFTAGGSFAAAGSNNVNGGGFNVYCFGEFLASTTASGGQSASATVGSAPSSSGSVIATFKDGTAVAGPTRIPSIPSIGVPSIA